MTGAIGSHDVIRSFVRSSLGSKGRFTKRGKSSSRRKNRSGEAVFQDLSMP